MQITVQVEHGGQVGPDSYESYTRVMDINDETTVKEIVYWAKRGMLGRVVKIVFEEAQDE